jgi:putative GTP pyrophosphokinase
MEDPTIIRKILEEFDRKEILLRSFSEACARLTSQILSSDNLHVHSVTSRLKERPKLEEKVMREGKDYRALDSVTDVVGVRIITHFEDEVDTIGTIIEREFDIDQVNSIDKRKILDPDRFGYLYLHYISTISKDRCKLPEYRLYEGLVCEIQIRSILQHAWAEIEHDLGYKAKSVIPAPVKRRFSRLAGLLELADSEFSRLRDDLQSYSEQVRKSIDARQSSDIDIDKVSLEAYIRSESLVIELDQKLGEIGHVEIQGIVANLDTIVSEMLYLGMSKIAHIHDALRTRKELLIKLFEAYQTEFLGEKKVALAGGGLCLHLLFRLILVCTSDQGKISAALRDVVGYEGPEAGHLEAKFLVGWFAKISGPSLGNG